MKGRLPTRRIPTLNAGPAVADDRGDGLRRAGIARPAKGWEALLNPSEQYRQAAALTAAPDRLLIMLFDGAATFGQKALQALAARDTEAAHRWICRVQDIVNELIVALDREKGGQLATNLLLLYDYVVRRLVEANVRKQAEPLQEALGVLSELRGAFAEASRSLRAASTAGVGPVRQA